jgi:hypothetical protein
MDDARSINRKAQNFIGEVPNINVKAWSFNDDVA